MEDFSRVGRLIQQQNNQRAAEQNRFREVQGGTLVLHGEFLVSGTGDSIKQVNFPAIFVEKPLFFFGAALNGTSLVDGTFPEWSATVAQFLTKNEGPQQLYFNGATIAVRSSGPAGQELWINWMAIGRSLSAPMTGDETSDSWV